MRLKTLVFAGALVAAGGVGVSTVPHFDRDRYVVKVTGTERVTKTDHDGAVHSKYVVFTKDPRTSTVRVFENTDSLLECIFGRCKFNSSDIQAQVVDAQRQGKTVELETYGWRIPFFSSYENIVSVTVTEENPR